MNTEKAILEIITQLKANKDYYRSWKDCISQAYLDNEQWYRQQTGKKYLNKKDKHIIANNASEHFLKLLLNRS